MSAMVRAILCWAAVLGALAGAILFPPYADRLIDPGASIHAARPTPRGANQDFDIFGGYSLK